jgi:hypothetical protein
VSKKFIKKLKSLGCLVVRWERGRRNEGDLSRGRVKAKKEMTNTESNDCL